MVALFTVAALAASVLASPAANLDSRIVNGIPTTAEDYPFIVDIREDWVQSIIQTNGTALFKWLDDLTEVPTGQPTGEPITFRRRSLLALEPTSVPTSEPTSEPTTESTSRIDLLRRSF